MIKDLMIDASKRMQKSIDALNHDLLRIRTGRAHVGLVDHIKVDYYGTETPLQQIANVSVEDARTLSITPWEKSMIQVIEKAILNSDLGLNPATAGTIIRIPIPALNEERRRELVKLIKSEGENAKISIRNIRRDANNDLKELLKEKEITEDEDRSTHDEIQKLTDKQVAEVDRLVSVKEKELLEI